VRGHALAEIVQGYVPEQVLERRRNRLEGQALRARGAGCEHRVAADVRAHVEEEVAWAKCVQHERHFLEIVQAAVNVARRSRHSALDQQTRAADERHRDRRPESATHLPAEESRKRLRRPAAIERVAQDIRKRGAQRLAHRPSRAEAHVCRRRGTKLDAV
jgi:hypothetical protein